MSTLPCSSALESSASDSLTPAIDGLRLIHADSHWVVVDKPADFPSVPGRKPELKDCAASRVQACFSDALTVHRLDMATSGLLLMARGLDTQRQLNRAFEQRQVDKRYVAVVAGEMADDEGEIDLPLMADWPRRPLQKVDAAAGKPACTRWQVLSRAPGLTRVLLQPITGRTHQLRLHLAAVGHPIWGDVFYAPEEVKALAPRLLLHASQLSLAHPQSGELCSFDSSAPF